MSYSGRMTDEEYRAQLFPERAREKPQVIVEPAPERPQAPLELSEYMEVADVCRILGKSQSWAYKDKTLPWIKVGKAKRMHRDDFNTVMAEKRNLTMQNIMRHRLAVTTTCKYEPMD